jgi:DNA-binding NarL/FixJ family response regulator
MFGGTLKAPIRVLVVDDYKPWHQFISTTLEKEPGFEIVARLSNGPQAVQQAEHLRPDLVLLDIGLPTLNGIEVARRLRTISPASKILFVSENRSPDVAQEALGTGAGGYVLKSEAASELLTAVKAVLAGKRFISNALAKHFLVAATVGIQAMHLSWIVSLITGLS